MRALVEAGHSIPTCSPARRAVYRGLDWRRMVNEDPYLPSEGRFSGVARRSEQLWMRAAEDYGWDPAQFSSEAEAQRQRDGS